MLLFIVLTACNPQEKRTMPPSRIPPVIEDRMVAYGSLQGYLIKSPPIQKAYLWRANKVDAKHQECAKKRLPNNSAALVIAQDQQVETAQSYLASWTKTDIIIEKLDCQ